MRGAARLQHPVELRQPAAKMIGAAPRYRPHRGYPLMVGRPPLSQLALGPMPMISLTLDDHAALARIRKAGARGVAVGDDLPVSRAIRLALTGQVTIDKASPQRVRMARLAP